jgi:hypothetical protein
MPWVVKIMASGYPARRGRPSWRRVPRLGLGSVVTLRAESTETDIEQIRELVDARELGVAFENFCTQLYEWDAVCSREQIDRIAYIGKAMGIKPDYWRIIATR